MFTGLVKATGRVVAAAPPGGGRLAIDILDLARVPEPGASVAVDGVCLTVTDCRGATAAFDVSPETLSRSTLDRAAAGVRVNLEPSLRVGDEMGGHWVTGHVDAAVRLLERRGAGNGGSVRRWTLPETVAGLVAEKGSVAISGVSLTVSALGPDWFEAAVIPETLSRTTLGQAVEGTWNNLEVDVLARYAARWMAWREEKGGSGRLTEQWLRDHGF